jgi:hypothetical protein
VFATVGSENYMKLKFPRLADNSTNDSLHAFGALRTFRAGWLWCSCCCAEQERCHATNTLPRKVPRPIAILLTTPLFVALGPFLWLPMETLSLAEQLQAHCWQKLSTFSCCKVAWNSFSPPLRRMNDNELQGENPAKWAWEKGSWGWIFDEMDALHYFFICM